MLRLSVNVSAAYDARAMKINNNKMRIDLDILLRNPLDKQAQDAKGVPEKKLEEKRVGIPNAFPALV